MEALKSRHDARRNSPRKQAWAPLNIGTTERPASERQRGRHGSLDKHSIPRECLPPRSPEVRKDDAVYAMLPSRLLRKCPGQLRRRSSRLEQAISPCHVYTVYDDGERDTPHV